MNILDFLLYLISSILLNTSLAHLVNFAETTRYPNPANVFIALGFGTWAIFPAVVSERADGENHETNQRCQGRCIYSGHSVWHFGP